MARCTKIINADSDDAKYIINVKQFAKFVVDLSDQVAPTDIEEGMRVGWVPLCLVSVSAFDNVLCGNGIYLQSDRTAIPSCMWREREREREREKDLCACHCRVDRNKYQIHIPLPPKIDPTVTMMQVEEKPDVTYGDVGGCKEQIDKLKEVVEMPLLNVSHLRVSSLLGNSLVEMR